MGGRRWPWFARVLSINTDHSEYPPLVSTQVGVRYAAVALFSDQFCLSRFALKLGKLGITLKDSSVQEKISMRYLVRSWGMPLRLCLCIRDECNTATIILVGVGRGGWLRTPEMTK